MASVFKRYEPSIFVFVASCLSLNVLANYVIKKFETGKILVLKLETMKQLESILLTWTFG